MSRKRRRESQLTEDLVVKIMGYVVGLNNLALVCNQWHKLLAPETGPCIPGLVRVVNMTMAHVLCVPVRQWWCSLRLPSQITNDQLFSLAAKCTAITTLDLSGCTGLTDKGLARDIGCKFAILCGKYSKIYATHLIFTSLT